MPSVARIVGITIASMMPSELNRICRSASAIGPLGSSTPSEQPPSATRPSSTKMNARRRMSDSGQPAAVIDQQGGKQQEEVSDGEDEQSMRGTAIGLAADAEAEREHKEGHAQEPGRDAVERAGKAQRTGQQRRRDLEKAVKQDLPHGRGVAGDDRQHGHAGAGVVVAAIEGERPEMRWRPQK